MLENRILDLGNGETRTLGLVVITNYDRTGHPRYFTFTPSQHSSFKNRKRASNWLARKGYTEAGERV